MAWVARFSRRAGPAFHLTWGICQRVRWGAIVVCPLPPPAFVQGCSLTLWS